MKKPSDLLKDVPLIGRYVRYEKEMLARREEKRQKKRKEGARLSKFFNRVSDKVGSAIRNAPVLGPTIRFSRAVREWLEDIPFAGPFLIKPVFSLVAFALRPVKTLAVYAVPFAAAGVVSFTLYNNPDRATDTAEDYLKNNGFDTAVMDGIEHDEIRIYRENPVSNVFHLAAVITAQQAEMKTPRVGEAFATAQAVAMYPVNLLAAGILASVKYNAFTFPGTAEGADCFVRPFPADADPHKMLATLAGIPQRHLNLDENTAKEWLPLMILAHEVRHCDNGKDTLAARMALSEVQHEYDEALREERRAVRRQFRENGEDYDSSDISAALADNERLEEIESRLRAAQEAISRSILAGEIDSDIHALEIMEQIGSDQNAADAIRYARAIRPFSGRLSIGGDEGHSTGGGVDWHLRGLGATAHDAWDSLYVAKHLLALGAFLNQGSLYESGHDATLQNYHVAKQVVIPYLEQMVGNTFQRGTRQVNYALALDHLRLFVEGMEYLVKPEALEGSRMETVAPIPPAAPSGAGKAAGSRVFMDSRTLAHYV